MSSSSLLVGRAQPLLRASRSATTTSRVVNKRMRLAPSAAASTTVERETTTSPVDADYDPSYEGPPAPAKKAKGRVILESEAELKSTWEHRAWVGGTTLALAGAFVNGANHVQGDVGEAIKCAAALYLAWSFADLGSGIYHWGVDKYVVVMISNILRQIN